LAFKETANNPGPISPLFIDLTIRSTDGAEVVEDYLHIDNETGGR
jgi:hypothetical protein